MLNNEDMGIEIELNLSDALAEANQGEDKIAYDEAQLNRGNFRPLFIEAVENSKAYGDNVHALLSDWEVNPNHAPSMRSIIGEAGKAFDLDVNSKDFQRALACGDLGHTETANGVEFHEAPAHPRKVLLQTIRLIASYNDLVERGIEEGPVLSEKEITMLMGVAAIHDLGHDGKGNGMGDTHQQYRLEAQSFEMFRAALGHLYSDAELDKIELILKCTDTSSPEGPLGPESPMMLMKRLYQGDITKDDLPDDMQGLINSRVLLHCLIINTADLATSAAISPERTRIESGLLGTEVGVVQIAQDTGSVGFIPKADITTLPAAKAAYGDNDVRIVSTLKHQLKMAAPKPAAMG